MELAHRLRRVGHLANHVARHDRVKAGVGKRQRGDGTLHYLAAGAFARETLNMAAQYADWLSPGDVQTELAIDRDAGAVVRDGLKKIAVYRDEKGQLHRRSAVCTHLGCIVAWNPTEKTWDCPCHGSRFDKLGEPLIGPANTPLAKVDSQEEAAD